MPGSPGWAYCGAWLVADLKVVVAQAAAPAGRQNQALPIFGDFELLLPGFGVAGHGAQRHLNHDILALGASAQVFAAVFAGLSNQVLLVLQVEQGPELGAAFQNNVAAAPAVAAVGAAVGQALSPEEMVRARPSPTRAAVDLNVVDEVIGSHFGSVEC